MRDWKWTGEKVNREGCKKRASGEQAGIRGGYLGRGEREPGKKGSEVPAQPLGRRRRSGGSGEGPLPAGRVL